MKNNALLLAIFAICAWNISTLKASEDGPYVQLFGGGNWASLDNGNKFKPANLHFKDGYIVGAALGYRIWGSFRMEAEYAYRYNKLNLSIRHIDEDMRPSRMRGTGKVDTSTALANLLWDIPIGEWGFAPYIGAGVGYGWSNYRSSGSLRVEANNEISHIEIPKGRNNANGFAWQAIGGVSVPLTLCIDLGIEYRYCKSSQHLRNQSVVLASKYLF